MSRHDASHRARPDERGHPRQHHPAGHLTTHPLLAAAPQNVRDALAASVPFPKRLGVPDRIRQACHVHDRDRPISTARTCASTVAIRHGARGKRGRRTAAWPCAKPPRCLHCSRVNRRGAGGDPPVRSDRASRCACPSGERGGWPSPRSSPLTRETIPDGPEGDAIRRGRDLFLRTGEMAPRYVGSGLTCGKLPPRCRTRSPFRADCWAAWGMYPAYRKKE